MWVSVFDGSLKDSIIEFIKGELLRMPGKEATYLHLQSLPPEQVMNSVLASAALPLLYQSQQLEGGNFYDGGIRDNTPVTPLLGQCDLCITTQLSNGSLFDRKQFATDRTQILEIRPSKSVVTEEGSFAGIQAMANFSADKINYLADMGYGDTMKALVSIKEVAGSRTETQSAVNEMDSLLDQL
ncbi:patatin-like phospholipase family protein [Endozoicomonas sp.]|uniref:patatin-like phospholipase family protein n=1 Tax=Endozoicomonas sp. TaxID=1892382 RepID=UPI00383AAD14